jgi:hypothetical protein
MTNRIRGHLVLATDDGVVICHWRPEGWAPVHRSLTGHHVTSILAREGVILAGTRDGIYRSDDGGASWREANRGLSTRLVRWMACYPDVSDRELAGTEPAGIFVSHDGGESWRSCPEVEEMRDRGQWFLPYSPLAGCVRGFAFHGDRVYAAVEVGGLLRSDGGGETWDLVSGSTGRGTLDFPGDTQVHSDVHSVVAHPSSPDVAFAATSGGLYITSDGGDTWRVSHQDSYCRAVWADPSDSGHLILGPAEGVSRDGRIEESYDSGATWFRASGHPPGVGLELPWPNRMVERFFHLGNELFAVTNDGRVYSSLLSDLVWRRRLDEVVGVTAIATFD